MIHNAFNTRGQVMVYFTVVSPSTFLAFARILRTCRSRGWHCGLHVVYVRFEYIASSTRWTGSNRPAAWRQIRSGDVPSLLVCHAGRARHAKLRFTNQPVLTVCTTANDDTSESIASAVARRRVTPFFLVIRPQCLHQHGPASGGCMDARRECSQCTTDQPDALK
jgi:hypothetical protein